MQTSQFLRRSHSGAQVDHVHWPGLAGNMGNKGDAWVTSSSEVAGLPQKMQSFVGFVLTTAAGAWDQPRTSATRVADGNHVAPRGGASGCTA